MIVKSAEFITSAAKQRQYPDHEVPEIAFAGRSNVGKSSLINCLLNRKSLVKTSRTPGRTQLINFFMINGRFCFVDLPGYGYAKAPDKIRNQWGLMVQDYLFNRKNLKAVVLVMDIRRTPREDEFNLLFLLDRLGLKKLLVLTKSDKLSGNKRANQQFVNAKSLNMEKNDLLLFSAKTSQGRDEAWEILKSVIGDGE
jgi:GTP-binding protein